MGSTTSSSGNGVRPEQVAVLQEATFRLTRRLRKYSGTDLTPSQISALTTVQRNAGLRVGDLARREQINNSSTTRLVGKLEKLGYLVREVDPQDARGFRVALTPQGENELAASRQRATEFLANELARLSDEDQDALLDALPALQRLIQLRRPTTG